MAQSIYPQELRENAFFSMYAEIAMESFYNALQRYEEVKSSNYVVSSMWELGEMDKHVISTVVFSAMCVESFLNNYAAACLGDSEFYDNFDKLSAIGKFQLISKFILKTDIDKEKSYYSLLKQLFKKRDSYVHNKSRKAKYQGVSAEDLENYQSGRQDFGEDNQYIEPTFPKKEVDADIREARDALKAVKEIALFFDEFDSEVYAYERLFHPTGVLWGHHAEIRYKSVVFPLLGIKVDKKHEI